MLIFIGLLSLIVGGAHFYIFSRLSQYLHWSGGARKVAMLFSMVMFVLTIGALPAIRALPHQLTAPIAWVAFSWMGILLFLTLTTALTDLFYILTALTSLPSDPNRREALQKMFGFATLGTTGLLSIGSLWNALRPVTIKSVPITIDRLPTSLSGLRIAQLTDLHLGPTIDGAWLQQVVDKTNALNPDIIAITGDLVDGSVEDLGASASALRGLRSKYGVFFVTGNHEYYSGADQWIAFLETLGIRVLRNERVTLDINGSPIDVAGIDDYSSSQFPGHGPDLPKALAGRGNDHPVILMAHQPIAVKEAALHKVDLQLSGHTHGGQIWPWNFLVLLQQPYVSGLHRHPDSDTQIYVSDGTGYWGPPMRLGTSAEITDITLHAPGV
jgi:predicted MPP superfamily phosphohydrolase